MVSIHSHPYPREWCTFEDTETQKFQCSRLQERCLQARFGVLINSRDSSFSCDSRNGFGKSDDVVLTLCNKGPAISVHALLQQCKINIAGWCFMNARSLTMCIRKGRSSYISFTAFLRDGHCFFSLSNNWQLILTHDSPSVSYIFQYFYMYISLIFSFFIS